MDRHEPGNPWTCCCSGLDGVRGQWPDTMVSRGSRILMKLSTTVKVVTLLEIWVKGIKHNFHNNLNFISRLPVHVSTYLQYISTLDVLPAVCFFLFFFNEIFLYSIDHVSLSFASFLYI